VAVADSFEAMTARRAYARPLSPMAAKSELVRGSGRDFDPGVVRAFLRISNGRLWTVLGFATWLAQLPAVPLWTTRRLERQGRQFASALMAGGVAVAMATTAMLPIGATPSGSATAVAPRAAASEVGSVASRPSPDTAPPQYDSPHAGTGLMSLPVGGIAMASASATRTPMRATAVSQLSVGYQACLSVSTCLAAVPAALNGDHSSAATALAIVCPVQSVALGEIYDATFTLRPGRAVPITVAWAGVGPDGVAIPTHAHTSQSLAGSGRIHHDYDGNQAVTVSSGQAPAGSVGHASFTLSWTDPDADPRVSTAPLAFYWRCVGVPVVIAATRALL
jgi:hypothetical protein